MALLRQHGDDADSVLVVGQWAGQHGADLPRDGGIAELGPPAVICQVLGADQFLDVERVDAGAFLMMNLQLLQVREPVI